MEKKETQINGSKDKEIDDNVKSPKNDTNRSSV